MSSQIQEGVFPHGVFVSPACTSSKRATVWLVMAFLAAGFLNLEAGAGFSSMYVFGDSLSAVSGGGTQYPPPPGASADNYWNGRFSNGRVWIEYLADLEGIRFDANNDFCLFGGVSYEVYETIVYGNYYPPADIATSLYVMWSACSDCLELGPTAPAATISNVMSQVTLAVGLLYGQGMRTLLLPNSVDITLTPFYNFTMPALGIYTGNLPTMLAGVRATVTDYNAALAATISQLRAQYPNLTIYAPDFYSQFNYGLSNPEIYGPLKPGLDALEDPALTDKSFDGPGANYVFWDYLHPTTKVHAFMASFAAQALAGPMFQQISLQGGSLRLELANLPVGRTGTLESRTRAYRAIELDGSDLYRGHELDPDAIPLDERSGGPSLFPFELPAMNAKSGTYNCQQLGFVALFAGALLGLGAHVRADVPEQVLKSFGTALPSGSQPVGVLVGADGALYGTTSAGGLYNGGTVFRVNVDGSGYSVLHAFGVITNDGVKPLAVLVQGRDGMLYGTTSGGGAHNYGTVFKVGTDGSGYTILYTLVDYTKDGSGPTALIQGTDGALYGVATTGGANAFGTLFRLGTAGGDYTVIYNFGSYSGDGGTPAALTQGADGALYGVTQSGVIVHPGSGISLSDGTVFRLTTDGSSYAILHSFDSSTGDGAQPVGLTQGSGGLLYGVTQKGGSNYNGVVFMLNTNGSGYTVAHQFTGTLGDGAWPGAGLLRGADGCWYGTTVRGGTFMGYGTVFRMNADCSGYRVIHRFSAVNSAISNYSTDGQQPGPLAQGPNGLLYGTTAYGGMAHPNGAGTLFALGTNATDYAVVYYFSNSGDEGQAPVAGLTLGRDGAFYGVTPSGGLSSQGLLFRINANGAGYGTSARVWPRWD